MLSLQPYYDSSSGAKLRISEQNTKFIENFRTGELELVRLACPRTSRQILKGKQIFLNEPKLFTSFCSELARHSLNRLRHFVWHLPEKCVLGYVLLPKCFAVLLCLNYLFPLISDCPVFKSVLSCFY